MKQKSQALSKEEAIQKVFLGKDLTAGYLTGGGRDGAWILGTGLFFPVSSVGRKLEDSAFLLCIHHQRLRADAAGTPGSQDIPRGTAV
jgi:hypothetical protein